MTRKTWGCPGCSHAAHDARQCGRFIVGTRRDCACRVQQLDSEAIVITMVSGPNFLPVGTYQGRTVEGTYAFGTLEFHYTSGPDANMIMTTPAVQWPAWYVANLAHAGIEL